MIIFDCVNHDILLDKINWLIMVLCVGNAYSWFKSYLCGRQQAAKFEGCLYAWGSIRVGYHKDQYCASIL